MADVPLMPADAPAAVLSSYRQYVAAYPANADNEVLINIWNWNRNWRLSVVDERGKQLACTPVWAYDPLHIAALTVPRFNKASLTAVPSFITDRYTHFFKAKADDPGRRSDDHRRGRVRPHVDRADATAQSLLDRSLQAQLSESSAFDAAAAARTGRRRTAARNTAADNRPTNLIH